MSVKRRYISARDTNPTPRYYWALFGNPYPNGIPSVTNDYASYTESLEESEGHPFQHLGKTDRDIGGDFRVVKYSYHEGDSSLPRDFSTTSNPYSPGRHHLTGQWAHKAGFAISDFPLTPTSSKAQLHSLGTTAIARVIPTNPLAGLTVAFAELRREGIPSLLGLQTMRNRAHVARSAGGEYLNVQFGWLPLVNDVKAMSNSYSNSTELVKQYELNSGKRLKRRYAFPDIVSNTVTDMGRQNVVPTMTPTGFYVGDTKGAKSLHIHTKVRRWFSGCFTYYLPSQQVGGDNSKRNAQLRNYLYGTRVTPDTLWNLAPWSWAADWVSNTGDVFHNISQFANDGLVMPYAYMMEESSTTYNYVLDTVRYKSYPAGFTYTQSFTTTVKQRVRATPFGFGLSFDAFTGRQKAIIAALGLSRSGNRLP